MQCILIYTPPADLARDRAAIAAATPGPWVDSPDPDCGPCFTVPGRPVSEDCDVIRGGCLSPNQSNANKEFIKAARTNFPRALTALEQAWWEISDGDYWMERAKQALSGGTCPVCFATDEAGHTTDCLWGKDEREIERLRAVIQRHYDDAMANELACSRYAAKSSGEELSDAARDAIVAKYTKRAQRAIMGE